MKLRAEDNDLLLVVNITELKKIKFALEGTADSEGSTTLNLDYNWTDFVGKGTIIDIVSIKKQTTE